MLLLSNLALKLLPMVERSIRVHRTRIRSTFSKRFSFLLGLHFSNEQIGNCAINGKYRSYKIEISLRSICTVEMSLDLQIINDIKPCYSKFLFILIYSKTYLFYLCSSMAKIIYMSSLNRTDQDNGENIENGYSHSEDMPEI